MNTTSKIIVPIDFLSYTNTLVEYSTAMADKLGADLCLFHVVQETNIYNDYIGPTIKHLVPEMIETAENKMRTLVDKLSSTGRNCSGKVSYGDVVEAIVSHAEEEDADMIILATHGRQGLEKLWLGSVAERVIRSAPCPTLTFSPAQTQL